MSNNRTDARATAENCLTAAQMRDLEQSVIQSGQVSGLALMERAGCGVVAKIAELFPGDNGGQALVLCGPGNNGGDGYVIARLLDDAGWQVTVAGLGQADRMPPDARTNRKLWEKSRPVADLSSGIPEPKPDLIVDAIFGIGLSRSIEPPLSDRFAEATVLATKTGALRLAVDLPSGLETDHGDIMGTVLAADETVTFHQLKVAHLKRPDLCGNLTIVDIGL
ncbi:MAG: NAD(P)H-hydrate epimerase [Pseudomonadota bacterium]